MKKLLAAVLLFSVILCFSACGGGEGGGMFESLTEDSGESGSESFESQNGGISVGEDSDADNWGEFTPFN